MGSPAGDRIREMRKRRKVSQGALGARLGHRQRWISERERGVVDTTADELVEIAEALGLAAAVVVVPAQHARLLERLEDPDLDPDAAGLALRLLEILPRIDAPTRRILSAMIREVAAERDEEMERQNRAS